MGLDTGLAGDGRGWSVEDNGAWRQVSAAAVLARAARDPIT